MSKLVERLRLGVDVDWSESILDEAADHIEQQDKRIAELEGLLHDARGACITSQAAGDIVNRITVALEKDNE